MTIRLDRRRFTLGTLACATSLGVPLGSARAAEAYPVRPIKWLVPYQPGTAPDTTARILAEPVGALLRQTVVIENKGGAGGNLGARQVATSPADGYTWIYSAAPMAANMRMYSKPGYDALKDFRHLMRLTSADCALIVPADSKFRTLADLVAHLKAHPGSLDYASGGIGTPSHLGMEMILGAQGVRAEHVPYKGASELVTAVMAKQVSFGVPISSVALGQVKEGKLRALAVTGHKRNTTLPDVPTLAESGVKGVELVSWGGVSVPARTPDDVVARVHAAFQAALKQSATIEALLLRGGQIDVQDAATYTRGFTQEIEFTETMMKRLKLEPV
jgi:tripartite-type tricarboxylate transporter receptor subunit TctC